MDSSSHWPPDEPVTPAAVVARLDHLGWTVDCTKLLDHTDRHALAAYDDRHNPVLFVVVDLRDGHTAARYGTEDAGRVALGLFARGGEPE